MANLIDLRSDTVTRPTEEMRRVMSTAEVGDDVYGEDPTINRLQEKLAGMLEKEAGLFMASGTMSNHVGIKSHTAHGQEVICHRWGHVFNFEGGAGPAMSGVGFNPIDGEHGVITAEQVEAAIRPTAIHYPQTALIAIENTHNKAGGTIFPLEEIRREAHKPHVKAVLSVEMSMGQMVEDVERSVQGVKPVEFYGKAGGLVPSPDDVVNAIHRLL